MGTLPRWHRPATAVYLDLMDDGIADKKGWMARRRAADEALACVWARELAAMSDEEALRRIKSLVTPDPVWRERPDWSGLVEQQALFQRRRRDASIAPRSGG